MIDWLYGIGISVSLTIALVMALKAVLRATEGEGTSRLRTPEAQALLDERDRRLLNLRELDFDHALNKVSDDDRRDLRVQLRSDLARVLQGLEALGIDPDTAAHSEYSETRA